MRFRDILIYVLCIAAAAGLFYTAAERLDSINAARAEMKLVSNEPLENAPPSLAFATVAMGAFRGLIVDILWLRAEQMKEAGEFYDAKQLADWITLLQPRFASVWDFQAWNMAYNISVTIPANRPLERWQWVRNGIELLRDKGIVKNPKNIKLYKALGWIFQHKMGAVTDDCHKFYKLYLYNAMKPLIDPQTEEFYEQLAAAPKTLDEILAVEGIAEFLNELASADDLFTDKKNLVENYLSLRRNPDHYSSELFSVIDQYRGSEVLEKFDIFARAYQLRNAWKMAPELMVELNRRYGPIDFKDPNNVLPLNWTNPDAHALYWGFLGLKVAGKQGRDRIEETNTDRLIFHSIQNLYRRGKTIVYITTAPDENDPCTMNKYQSIYIFPDLRMYDRYDMVMCDVLKKHTEIGGNLDSLYNAYKNMRKRAVALFYQAGNRAKALQIYNSLRKDHPDEIDLQGSLSDYAKDFFITQLSNMDINDAREIISGMLMDAYYHYALRDDDEAFGREKMAREVYDHYQTEYATEGTDRIVLPGFSVLRYVGLTAFLNDQRYPQQLRMNMFERIRIERPELFEELEKQHEALMQQMNEQERQDNE